MNRLTVPLHPLGSSSSAVGGFYPGRQAQCRRQLSGMDHEQVLHGAHKVGIRPRRHEQACPPPRLEVVNSARRTVSVEMESTTSYSTTLSPNRIRPQRACPSRGSMQVSITSFASTSRSSGRLFRLTCLPHRLRTRQIVAALFNPFHRQPSPSAAWVRHYPAKPILFYIPLSPLSAAP